MAGDADMEPEIAESFTIRGGVKERDEHGTVLHDIYICIHTQKTYTLEHTSPQAHASEGSRIGGGNVMCD